MTLDEFVEQMEKDLERFRENYRDNQKRVRQEKLDENWPTVQSETDWFEQFVAFQG